MRTALWPLLLAAPLLAGGPPEPETETIRHGLLAPGREAREDALERARRLARVDPAGLDPLWDELDLRGRCLLVRALASAGHGHAAAVALRHASDPEPEIFRALLEGLAQGGRRCIFAEAPADLAPGRRGALERLRLQWRVEEELARLKSQTGQTGHYLGQYGRLKEIGPGALDVLLNVVRDRERPLFAEGGAGPYRSIVPGMIFFEPGELRSLAAYAFGELVPPDDEAWKERIEDLFWSYWGIDEDDERYPMERERLAPALAFSLYDLGVTRPGETYLRELQTLIRRPSRRRDAIWELGYALMRLGRYDEGVHWYERLLASGEGRAVTAYNLACAFSVRAMKEPRYAARFKATALDYLRQAIEEYGYADWQWMEEDGDLAFIRKEPEYQRLLKKLRTRFPDRRKGRVSKDPREFLGED